MGAAEKLFFLLLAVINLSFGGGLAFPLTGILRRIRGTEKKSFRYFLIFIGIYFFECIAFPMGMCTQVFTISLSIIWSLFFGLWLRKHTQRDRIMRLANLVAIYGTLPTASFCIIIPVVQAIGGRNILSRSEGQAFGIPDFLPWPFNSIMGFFTAVLAGTLILKIFVSLVTVSYLTNRFKSKEAE